MSSPELQEVTRAKMNLETARIAVQAALTGHFVLPSLHAIDAPAALHRLLDIEARMPYWTAPIGGTCHSLPIRSIPPPTFRGGVNSPLKLKRLGTSKFELP